VEVQILSRPPISNFPIFARPIQPREARKGMETGENKNPTLETLKKVAKALDVSVDDLIN